MMLDPNPLAHFWEWVEIHVGAQNESQSFYGFWSGFGSDLGEVALIGSIIAAAHHVNCHSKGCWRPGHKVHSQPYRLCHVHHPHHRGDKRNVPQSQIEECFR